MKRLTVIIAAILIASEALAFGFGDPIGIGDDWTADNAAQIQTFFTSIDDCPIDQVLTGAGTNTTPDCGGVDGLMIDLPSQAAGDVMYFNGTGWVRLAKGIAGQVLEMNAGATAPEWDTDDSGGSSGLSISIPAGGMEVDGTQCVYSTAAVVNGGPKIRPINCTDNTAGIIYFEFVLPTDYAGDGTLEITAQAYTVESSPSGDVLALDASCMARGNDEAIDSTWSSAVAVDFTFTHQYRSEHVLSASITPNGTASAGDTIYCRMVVDATTTTGTVADMRFARILVED